MVSTVDSATTIQKTCFPRLERNDESGCRAYGKHPSSTWTASVKTGVILAVAIAVIATCTTQGFANGKPAIQTPENAAVDSVIIVNGTVVDGTGRARYAGAIRLVGDTIAEVGDISPRPGEDVVDARGQIVAPGFVDTHSHLDLIVDDDPQLMPAITQGITTIVVGQDGFSPHPLRDWYSKIEASGTGPNVASFVGHNTLRSLILKGSARRQATAPEIDQMNRLLADEIRVGGLGLSTGLEYDTGIYSNTTEIISLAATAAKLGGRYITHIRSEDREIWSALDEAIDVGRQTGIPVQISHIKLSMMRLWGQAAQVLHRLNSARHEGIDVSADIYPYTYWKSTMTVLLPERNLNDRAAVEFAFREIVPPESIVLTLYKPDPLLEGSSIAEIARRRGLDPVTMYLRLLSESETLAAETGVLRQEVAGIVAHAMSEKDVQTFLQWGHTNVCSDGERGVHPRAYGAYPRVLARYVREQSVLTLEDAIRRMSSLAAAHVGIRDRGTLATGMRADVILFDLDEIQDHASIEHLNSVSSGIDSVWVNGKPVIAGGVSTGNLPGRVLRSTTTSAGK